MTEVLYSEVKFKTARGNTHVATPSAAEACYSEVKSSKAQRPAELPGYEQPAASSRRPWVTWERAALLVLAVLLAAAAVALGVTFYKYTQTEQSLQKLQDEHEENYHSDEPSLNCSRCEDGWEPHGGQCYYFSWTTSTWDQSRMLCRSLRGHLVVVDSREEQQFLVKRLKVKMLTAEDKFWIGLTDSEKESQWLWVDNTPLNPSLTFWLRKEEPDNWSVEDEDGEDCVRMGEKAGAPDLKCWVDKSCKKPHKCICEKRQRTGFSS